MDTFGDKIDSKFRFVLLAAERAEQIMRGARSRVEAKGSKTVRVAMDEVRSGLIDWDYGPAPEPTAATSEDEATASATADVH